VPEVRAVGGRINIAAVNSKGKVIPTTDDLDVSSFTTMGNVTINQRSKVFMSDSTSSSESSEINNTGEIFIRGNQILIDHSYIYANVYHYASPGKINLSGHYISIQNHSRIEGYTSGVGNGATINLEAKDNDIYFDNNSDIYGYTTGSGNGATITLTEGNNKRILHGGVIIP